MTLLIYEFGEKKEEKSPLALATPATIAVMISALIDNPLLSIALYQPTATGLRQLSFVNWVLFNRNGGSY